MTPLTPVGSEQVTPESAAPKRVIGLDISLTATGISDGRDTWLIASAGKKDATLLERQKRLLALSAQIVVKVGRPDLLVIEQPAFSRQTGHMHDRSGLWWLLVQDFTDMRVPIAEVSPTVLKKWATGKGNANKGAMIDAAVRRFPHIETLGDDNRVDALWLSALGHEVMEQPLVPMPAAQRATMLSVRWPEVP